MSLDFKRWHEFWGDFCHIDDDHRISECVICGHPIEINFWRKVSETFIIDMMENDSSYYNSPDVVIRRYSDNSDIDYRRTNCCSDSCYELRIFAARETFDESLVPYRVPSKSSYWGNGSEENKLIILSAYIDFIARHKIAESRIEKSKAAFGVIN